MKSGIGAVVCCLVPACWIAFGQTGTGTIPAAPGNAGGAAAARAKLRPKHKKTGVDPPGVNGGGPPDSPVRHSSKAPLASYTNVKTVLDAYPGRLPAELE